MANVNMKVAREVVKALGMEAQLIPSASNPLNCKTIIVNGRVLKSSQWNKAQIMDALKAIKEGHELSKNDEYRKETIKSNITELIPFNCSINETLKEYVKLQSTDEFNNLETWIEGVIDFYCVDDKINSDNIKLAEETIKNLIVNGDMVICYGDMVLNRTGIQEVIKEWLKQNNKSLELIDTIYTNFVNYLKK